MKFLCTACKNTTPDVDELQAGCKCTGRLSPCIMLDHRQERIHLGRGELNWNGVERRDDRYGTVRLFECDEPFGSMPLHNQQLHGEFGRLVAVVVDPRQSPHIGDMSRSRRPKNLFPKALNSFSDLTEKFSLNISVVDHTKKASKNAMTKK